MDLSLSAGERRAFDALVKLRQLRGLSPTLKEIGVEVSVKSPPNDPEVRRWMLSLQEKGWVEKLDGHKRHWVPTWESRMVEKHGEILYFLRVLANHDSSAEHILRYVEGFLPD